MTIPFFKRLYKAFSLGICLTTPLYALTPEQELKTCKSALFSQLNEQKRMQISGCPVAEKLVYWLGILRDPNQFTHHEPINFLSSHTHWPHHEKLCRKAEEVIVDDASSTEILSWFGKHSPQTPVGVIAYASALIEHKENTKAANLIIQAWRSMEFSKIEEKEFLTSFANLLQEKDHYARLQFLLWNENVDEAKRLMPLVSDGARKAAEVRIAFIEGNSTALEKMHGLNNKQRQEEGLLYETAKWFRKQKDFDAANEILLKAPVKPAHAQNWWKEKNYIAREFIAAEQYQAAYNLIQNHRLQPGNEDFANAEWLSGWLALRFLHQPKDAERHFDRLFSNVEGAVSKARAAYWMGRTHEHQGQIDLAGKWYRKAAKYKTIYYGQLAAAKLSEKPYPVLATAPKTTLNEKKNFDQKDLVKAAHILKGLGKSASHELSKFLLHIAGLAKSKGERELAVHLSSTLSPHDVVWAAKKAGYSEPVTLKNAYPICKIPRKGQRIPETALVMAVAYQESRFNPTAKSTAGAVGLLQLCPKTAAQEAKRLGVKHCDSKLCDPSYNLHLGSAHLSHLLNNFESSYILTLAAYNAGPEPVARWLQDFGDPRRGEVDIIDWIELIPYAETRNYVMRVLENITIYRSLEGQPKKTLLDDLQG
ncbi:MAG TPA: transglycosylase SLT domain-containing protein [Alphaproteobacteria bacterium]|nr:transglycosylase SLT domain-containing protein [Alphaproteobacteria bacterium]